MIATEQKLLTVKETAAYVGQSERTIRRLIQTGCLPRVQIRRKGRVLIRMEDIQRALEPR